MKLMKQFSTNEKKRLFKSILKTFILAQDKENYKKVKNLNSFVEESLSKQEFA